MGFWVQLPSAPATITQIAVGNTAEVYAMSASANNVYQWINNGWAGIGPPFGSITSITYCTMGLAASSLGSPCLYVGGQWYSEELPVSQNATLSAGNAQSPLFALDSKGGFWQLVKHNDWYSVTGLGSDPGGSGQPLQSFAAGADGTLLAADGTDSWIVMASDSGSPWSYKKQFTSFGSGADPNNIALTGQWNRYVLLGNTLCSWNFSLNAWVAILDPIATSLTPPALDDFAVGSDGSLWALTSSGDVCYYVPDAPIVATTFILQSEYSLMTGGNTGQFAVTLYNGSPGTVASNVTVNFAAIDLPDWMHVEKSVSLSGTLPYGQYATINVNVTAGTPPPSTTLPVQISIVPSVTADISLNPAQVFPGAFVGQDNIYGNPNHAVPGIITITVPGR